MAAYGVQSNHLIVHMHLAANLNLQAELWTLMELVEKERDYLLVKQSQEVTWGSIVLVFQGKCYSD